MQSRVRRKRKIKQKTSRRHGVSASHGEQCSKTSEMKTIMLKDGSGTNVNIRELILESDMECQKPCTCSKRLGSLAIGTYADGISDNDTSTDINKRTTRKSCKEQRITRMP